MKGRMRIGKIIIALFSYPTDTIGVSDFIRYPTGSITKCPVGAAINKREVCITAGLSIGGSLRNGSLIEGYWDHTPQGCFIAEDRAVHYNLNTIESVSASNDMRYSTVCKQTFVNLPQASVAGCVHYSASPVSKDDCVVAGLSVGGILRDGDLVQGSWTHTPTGCFLAEDFAVHYNINANGSMNDSRYSSICRKMFLKTDGECPPGADVSKENCIVAGLSSGGILRNDSLVEGHWDHTPHGCFVAEDLAVHYNSNPNPSSGGNDARYSAVCHLYTTID